MYLCAGGNKNDGDDDRSYCESCITCNPDGADGSSPSSSDASSDARSCVVDYAPSAPTPRRVHAKYVPTYPAYPKQHSFIVDMNNRPLYEVEKKPKSPSRRKRATSASPSKGPFQTAISNRSGCRPETKPETTPSNNAPYFPPGKKEVKDKKKEKKNTTPPPASAASCGEWSKALKKMMLYAVVTVIVVSLYFALLGMTVRIDGEMSGIKSTVDKIESKVNAINVSGNADG